MKRPVIWTRTALDELKAHCSILAEDAIKAAVDDYRAKTGMAITAKAH